jgi:glyoxylase-like metal-dependent hydrolase (beta-lactamase superfamily II)
MTQLTRRALLAGTAAATAALPALATRSATAAAPVSGQQAAGVYRYKIGSYELTALNDGVWNRKIDDKFVRNVSWPEVQKALADNFFPAETLPIPFTTLAVNTGSKLVLIDTGTGGQLTPTAGTMGANLAAAGIDPKAVDIILISHFHPDHINGLKTKEGQRVFPNAEVNVSAPEWAFWMDDAKMNAAPEAARPGFLNARRVFNDIAKDVKRFEPGGEVAPGITSIAAYGHTPGHTAFAVASGNQSMLVLGDTTNHPWLFVRNPEWQAIFDTDPVMATETRKKLLDRASADKMLVQGYHFPFPASGYIAKRGTGYDLVPVMWQPAL